MPWHCKPYGGYAKESTEAKDNAIEIADILRNVSWTLNAIAGMLGNVGWEGGYNPWRWESDDVLASTDIELIATSTVHGYGLYQFTPSGKYIMDGTAQTYRGYGPNYSDIVGSQLDGEAQVIFLNFHADYYQTPMYPLSYQEYKESEADADWLAAAWFYNYERGTWNVEREVDARYWYDFLVDHYGEDTKKKKSKWIYYMKRRRH